MSVSPFAIERVGDLQRVWIGLDNAAQTRTAAIHGFDALQVGLDQLAGGQRAGSHPRLQLLDRDFVQIHAVRQHNSR